MRLIDADAIEMELGVEDRDLYVQHILDSAPTIEAEPIKHGADDGLIFKDTARRIIDSPRSKSQMLSVLKALPTIEVEPIKRGRWIDEPIYKQTMDGKTWDGYTYCSECKEMHEYGYRSNYCPNCGAKMDEVE